MERKKLSEVAQLKIRNCDLSLQILQMQTGGFIAEKQKILLDEFKRLECDPAEWTLDNRTWELIEKPKGK